MVIRLDDISANTDFEDLKKQIEFIRGFGANVIAGVTVFSKTAYHGSIYPDLPLKNKPLSYLYDVNQILDKTKISFLHGHEIASHGILHVKHSEINKDAQEMSIVSSCRFLNSNKFIPPFNSYNKETLDICANYGIELINNRNQYLWRSLETDQFDPSHVYWYYHPWRINAQQLKESLDVSKINV